MHIEAKLRELGLELPEVKKPAGLYVFTKRVGNLVYVSGQTPDIGSILQYKGVVGEDMSIETAQQAAQLAALNILAVLKLDLGDLDRIRQIVQVVVMSAALKALRISLKSLTVPLRSLKIYGARQA